ncbi:MAG: hypothetical protein LAQ30_00445 [Acidobacteriia bacterium]|nr:hypothetical protein [Terriglobia bacterium]
MPDARLRLELETLHPPLANAPSEGFASVDWLRDWLYSRLIVASPQCLLPESAWNNLSGPASLLQRFEDNEGGVWCSGASALFAALCELFGFRTASIHAGDPRGAASHVFTLVEVVAPGGPVWSVQDAYFNYTVVGLGGEHLDYFSFLDALHTSDPAGPVASNGPSRHCWVLYHPERDPYNEAQWEFVFRRVRNPQPLPAGRVKAEFHQWNLGILNEPIFQHYPEWLCAHGGSTDPIRLLGFPFFWNAPPDLDARLQRRTG